MANEIEQFLEIKTKLEQSISKLTEKHNDLRDKIAHKQEARLAIECEKKESTQKLYQLKLARVERKQKAEAYQALAGHLEEWAKKAEDKIREEVRISEFESDVSKLIEDYDGAMEYYRDDSLNMELMKRSNAVREKRVEYTQAENEYKETLRKIEEAKREKERQLMAEQQRQRELEEQEKREKFLKSRAAIRRSPSPSLPPPPSAPLIKAQEAATKLPEQLFDGGLSQFMRW